MGVIEYDKHRWYKIFFVKLLKDPTNELRFMNVILLLSDRRHVSDARMVICWVMITTIQI